MELHLIEREQRISRPPVEVFSFFADARNLERITPPFLRFRLVGALPDRVEQGTLIRYRLRLHGIPIRWLTRIEEWHPNRRFSDLQLRGPYRYWHHTHEFEPDRSGGTLMRDTVRYAMRAGPLGRLVRRLLVEGDLQRVFDYRRDEIARIFA